MTSTIPRNYVSSLEAQVEELIKENEELRTYAQTPARHREEAALIEDDVLSRFELSTSPAVRSCGADTGSKDQDLIKSMQEVVNEPATFPRFLGVSSGITLARMVMAAIRIDAIPSPSTTASLSPASSLYVPAAQASLPPRHAADHLVDVYFQYQTAHFPIVERWQVKKALDSAYRSVNSQQTSDRDSERDIFTAYMIFAIALCDVYHPSGGRPTQSEGCFHSALRYIDKVFVYSSNDLEALRAILLLAQYVALCPSKGSLWMLSGTAIRLSVDMGLHWQSEESSLNMDAEVDNDRRRLWNTTYLFDRLLCIPLGRPSGIPDQGINVAYPSPYAAQALRHTNPIVEGFDLHARKAHNHLLSITEMESEIKNVLYSQFRGSEVAYPRTNYPVWIQDIQPRLQQWYSAIPPPSMAHPSSIFASQAYWDALYYNALLFLHRPNPKFPELSREALHISFDASCKLITSIKILQRERKIDIMWKWVQNLFMAGLTLVYTLWHSKEMRGSASVRDSISALQSCTSTLSALSERWAGAGGCRDVFETLSSATVSWLIANNAEEVRQNQLNLENQLQDLYQQWPPSGITSSINGITTDDVLAMLHADSFKFGETLSSTAQWPSNNNSGYNIELESIFEVVNN